MLFGPNIEALEQKYTANSHNGIRSGNQAFRIIEGKIPILLSAPHAVRQIRKNTVKASDAYTGAMLEYLCAKTGAYGIVRFYNDSSDPNFDESGRGKDYRDAAVKLCKDKKIKMVLDLHASSDSDCVAEIGTNSRKNLNGDERPLKELIRVLSKIDEYRVDEKFLACNPCTVSCYISDRVDIPCLQLEMASGYRKDPSKRSQLLKGLENYIGVMKKML